MSQPSAQLKLPPPSGDPQVAQKYADKVSSLIGQNKVVVIHTDLSRYDPSSLHDHYRIDLGDYQIEISHSKQPLNGTDSYVMLFNNLRNLREGLTQKVILAYLILSAEQFNRLKQVSDEQIETRRKIEEQRRFQQAMNPVDELLEKISQGQVDLNKQPGQIPEVKEPVRVSPPPARSPEDEKSKGPTLAEVEKALQEAAQQPNTQPPPQTPPESNLQVDEALGEVFKPADNAYLAG